MEQKTYYDITKEYPDMYRVMIYKTPYTPKPINRIKNIVNMSLNNNSESNIDRSVRRTRRTLHDLVKCNDFSLFVTFTFDPKKVNRYDINSTYLKMQGWLWRQHQKNKELKYIIVPEKHKDGAIHFHALLNDYTFDLKQTNVIQDSRRVYNIPSYRFGFTNATNLEDGDKEKTANYIAKYITKDMVLLNNRRRYWASKNLLKPRKFYNSIYDLGLAARLNYKTEVLETDYNTIYEVPRDLFDR